MSNIKYRAIIEQDEDGVYVASVPSVPGCHSQGETFEEAVQNVKEALELCLEVAKEDRQYNSNIQMPQTEMFSVVDIPVVNQHA